MLTFTQVSWQVGLGSLIYPENWPVVNWDEEELGCLLHHPSGKTGLAQTWDTQKEEQKEKEPWLLKVFK